MIGRGLTPNSVSPKHQEDAETSSWAGQPGSWPGGDLRRGLDRPLFALAHRFDHDVSDQGVTLPSGGVTDAVATTLAAADGKNIGILGANTAQQYLAAGLVDELLVCLAPVLHGDGIRLYGGPGAGRVSLEPISVAQPGQVTDLRFRVLN